MENTELTLLCGVDYTENISTVLLRGACWNMFTEPLPSKALSKFVTICLLGKSKCKLDDNT
jgi:hypothetical protein